MAKRLFDFLLSLSGIVASSSLWMLVVWAVFLEDGLPLWYVQERVGKNGKYFKAIKFRSMRKDAESNGPQQAC
ncbi:MAG: sugar transferase, partial [Candidatus Omnitrophica bacterium]|nr:sugar transferase [Candidatus Omnitrophota bacterium]